MKQISEINYKAFIFDLDDTLLDTYNCIIPAAMNEACRAMIDQGLKASMDQCLSAHRDEIHLQPRRSFFRAIVEEYNSSDQRLEDILLAGTRAFYEREVKEELKFTPGGEFFLKQAQAHADVHLVTSGHSSTQQQKINQLGLANEFKSITVVNALAGENKRNVFESILNEFNYSPETVLVVGDRRDQEILYAKELGMRSCLVKFGEYKNLQPSSPREIADIEVNSLEELPALCQTPN